jgi:hypothetical protein
MIVQSATTGGNAAADWLMEQYIDPVRAPLVVTEDLRVLGYQSTFLAGHFWEGAPLLASFTTPGNSRTDLYTYPDPFNQTTLTEMGMLLVDIYQCAEYGGGALIAVFPGEITQQECKDMIELLTKNDYPYLIKSGSPDSTKIAHKHGFISDLSGAITDISEAAIVYTKSGNYVLVIFFSHPQQILWDPIRALFSNLAAAVYNYYNLPAD